MTRKLWLGMLASWLVFSAGCCNACRRHSICGGNPPPPKAVLVPPPPAPCPPSGPVGGTAPGAVQPPGEFPKLPPEPARIGVPVQPAPSISPLPRVSSVPPRTETQWQSAESQSVPPRTDVPRQTPPDAPRIQLYAPEPIAKDPSKNGIETPPKITQEPRTTEEPPLKKPGIQLTIR